MSVTNFENQTEEEAKKAVHELLEGASLQRMQTVQALIALSESEAAAYGDALSLLIGADYNIGTIKQAISAVKDEQGLQIVRTRTKVRTFKFSQDEDDPDAKFEYRAFYVKMITPEQRIAIQDGRAEKLQGMLGNNMKNVKGDTDAAKMAAVVQSEAFRQLLAEPNQQMRKIVKENMVEVKTDSGGNTFKPITVIDIPPSIPEFIYQQLEDDLRLLIEQQGVMAKNSLVTDMLDI